MNYRHFARNTLVLAACALAPAGCASTNPATIPPTLPAPTGSVTAPYTETVAGAADASVTTSLPDHAFEVSLASASSVPSRFAAPNAESSAPRSATDPLTAERRSVEALDRIAGLVPIKEGNGGRVLTLSTDDLFAPGDWRFAPNVALRLEDLAAALRLQGDKTIDIDGFTDSLGSAQENEYLSLKRATALRDFLAAHGVDASKMKVQGLGSRRPVADNSDAFGRAENRRIEISIRRSGGQRAERSLKPRTFPLGGA